MLAAVDGSGGAGALRVWGLGDMRGHLLLVAFAAVIGCMPDTAHLPVRLQPPYSELPRVPPETPIEAGQSTRLDARQQEAVVTGVMKWMKDPGTAQFGAMAATKNSKGLVAVCGHVNGRNSTGAYVGMAPFIGVLAGPASSLDFVVVEIGSNAKDRAVVESLCREKGIL